VRDVIRLPKADLHVHFQGSIRPSTVRELAAKHGCELPPGLDGDVYRWSSFADFITQYGFVCRTLREPEDYRRAALEIAADEAGEGVRYAEVTLTVPGERDPDPWRSAIAAALDGFAEAQDRYGIVSRLVLDHVRGWPLVHAEALLETALAFGDRGVVALGLGGLEARPGEPVASVFGRAIAEGLHSVPHAGEAEGPLSIREALDLLGAERLGHGIRVLDDPDLTDEVRERRIPLEVCPTSNVATRLVERIEDHPLPRLVDAGLVVTLNSDDPAMFSSPVAGEYRTAREVFGYDDDALAGFARSSIEASFAGDDLKRRLIDEIEEWLA